MPQKHGVFVPQILEISEVHELPFEVMKLAAGVNFPVPPTGVGAVSELVYWIG